MTPSGINAHSIVSGAVISMGASPVVTKLNAHTAALKIRRCGFSPVKEAPRKGLSALHCSERRPHDADRSLSRDLLASASAKKG